MTSITRTSIAAGVVAIACAMTWAHQRGARLDAAQVTTSVGAQHIDLQAALAANKVRSTGRDVTPLRGSPDAVRVGIGTGFNIAWIDGTDFGLGTLEIDLRGTDLLNLSCLGIAFHRRDDATYEDVYLRPYNFRASDLSKRRRAIQYESMPEYPWSLLRERFPDEFENGVDQSLDPNQWLTLRVVVSANRIQAFAGRAASAALDVRRLSQHDQGQVGLWVGNYSPGDFANLRITPAR